VSRRFPALALLAACTPASADDVGPGFAQLEFVVAHDEDAPRGELQTPPGVEDAPDDDAVMAEAGPEPELDPDPDPERNPIGFRINRHQLSVYAKPSKASPIRGKIPIHKVFEVFAHVEGPGCGGLGWADVGGHGYACLEDTWSAKETQRPKELPPMRGGLTPFYYAKLKGKGSVARRWKNLAAIIAGEPHLDTLKPDTDYAFTYRKRHRGDVLLIDEHHRVVLEKEVMRYRPSRFEGRDLVAHPIPQGRRLAWAVKWPETSSRKEASADAALAASIGYHDELLVDPEPVGGKGGPWYRLADGTFIREGDVQVLEPAPGVPSDVGPDEIWLDVDLEQQTLAAMRGSEPFFATLVSSGFKRATPRGIFRIHWKQAIGSMQSEPGADDPYNVEAVPHVQYFVGGFALHSAYWHNFFGRRISHGCVNLAPKDALRVFRMTSPELRGGWLHAYETRSKLGTTVVVRKGGRVPKDRRNEPEANFRYPM
jgi:lipoprotein-anchoring transpeptidase ErfK/SrfK